MAEGNGNRESRLDRIERALELMISDHEQFRDEHKRLLTSQILQGEHIRQVAALTEKNAQQIAELRAHGAETDKRISGLVSAIGKLISKEGR